MKKKLLYLVTEDWYFCSHRLPIAMAAREAGYDVGVITQVTRHGAEIESAGIKLFPVRFARSGRRPIQDLRTMLAVARIYRAERPDLVHHVSMKPILYGTAAAAFSGVPRVINAYTGLGFLFSSDRAWARVMRGIMTRLSRPLLGSARCWSIVQNAEDEQQLLDLGLLNKRRSFLIRGSGVDVTRFRPSEEHPGETTIMLAARMLWDKGVGEFVAAARRLRAEGIRARFVLVGDPDPENPMCIKSEVLRGWQEEGFVDVWGRKENMDEVLPQAHIVCLPSYREGLPKILLEAAACGRPIVATDIAGCREVVHNGVTGLLVPPRDEAALADAIRQLATNSGLRRMMGAEARKLVEEKLTVGCVVKDTLAAYCVVLSAGS